MMMTMMVSSRMASKRKRVRAHIYMQMKVRPIMRMIIERKKYLKSTFSEHFSKTVFKIKQSSW